MKHRYTPLALGLCILGLVSLPVNAQSNSNSSNKALEKKLAAMEKDLQNLKRQLNDKSPKQLASNKKIKSFKASDPKPDQTMAGVENIIEKGEASDAQEQKIENSGNDNAISGPEYLPEAGLQYLPIDIDVPGQSFVSTGPYIGVPLQFAGNNLIINNPSINQDVALLNLRKNINKRLCALGLNPETEKSHLLLSGIIEGQAFYKATGGGKPSSDIDLTSAGIDAYVLTPSSWVSGLMSLRYDNANGAPEGTFANFSREQNSRVFIDKAFIVVGDFCKCPLYFTIGQMYVPFGLYSTSMISSPLTKALFRTQERAVLVGYQGQCENAFYASAFIFRGDSFVGSTPRIDNGGFNFGYKFKCGDYFSGNVGASAIANVADSQGMQNNGFSVVPFPLPIPPSPPLFFTGFGGVSNSGSEHLSHMVPGGDIRGLISIGKSIDLLAEYITAINRFSTSDATYNGHGARPQALNAEAAYTFQGTEKPVAVAIGYGFTKDALAFALPAQRYSAALNTSIWRNTLQSLEFRHDVNYPASATSTGSGLPGPTASGQRDNVLTAQFDIYF